MLPHRVRGITRRWPRGVVRVLLEALQQLLHSGLQRGNARFESPDILLDGDGGVLPQLWWKGWYGVHEPRSYAVGYWLASRTDCDHVNAYKE